MKYVRKSDGNLELFNQERITNSILESSQSRRRKRLRTGQKIKRPSCGYAPRRCSIKWIYRRLRGGDSVG